MYTLNFSPNFSLNASCAHQV